MRVIKFRVWDSKNKIMSYQNEDGDYAFIDGHEPVRSDQSLACILSGLIPDLLPMQFTGLEDKNKKEIYEGDICEQITPNHTKIKMVCRWGTFQRAMDTGWTVDISGFCFERSDGLLALPIVKNWMGKHDLETLEVIGNIYQHPELIPANKKPRRKK